MTQFTSDDVAKIAHLARLEINVDKIPEYMQAFTNILALIDQIQQVDTSQVDPLSHPLHATQRLRADESSEPDLRLRNTVQDMAPSAEAGLYLVPKVID